MRQLRCRETYRAASGPLRHLIHVAVSVCGIMALAAAACAAPHVSFAPSHVLAQPDSVFHLSIRAAASGDAISGCQLFLSFDPVVIELAEAAEGTLYAECGHLTLFLADELEAGRWRLFDTTFGPGTFVMPPGELFHLTFRPVDYGHTQTHIDTIYMSDAAEPPNPILGITCEDGYVFVVDPTAVDEEVPGVPELGPVYPNPFGKVAVIPFHLPEPGLGRQVEIYDSAGRLVRRIALPARTTRGEIIWDGRADDGCEVASSVYFIRLGGARGSALVPLVRLR